MEVINKLKMNTMKWLIKILSKFKTKKPGDVKEVKNVDSNHTSIDMYDIFGSSNVWSDYNSQVKNNNINNEDLNK